MTYQLKNIRVLVIDENQPIRLLVRNLLLDLGVGMVDIAPNPKQGWELFTQFKQDLLLVDWPVLNGRAALDFVRKIRRDAQSPDPHVPVLLMTGFSSEERVFHARDAGITEFMTKPITIPNLVRFITHIVENPRPFIEAPVFTGPDRRRRFDPETPVDDRRKQQATT
jgi:two-component system, chemotaxis family, chemotaxis protein CheY